MSPRYKPGILTLETRVLITLPHYFPRLFPPGVPLKAIFEQWSTYETLHICVWVCGPSSSRGQFLKPTPVTVPGPPIFASLWCWHTQDQATSMVVLPETSFVKLLPCLGQPFAPNAAALLLHGSTWRIHAANMNPLSKVNSNHVSSMAFPNRSLAYFTMAWNQWCLVTKKGNSLRSVILPCPSYVYQFVWVHILLLLYIHVWRLMCIYT